LEKITGMRQTFIYIIKICIGAALVYWLLQQVDRDKFFDYFRQLDALTFLFISLLSMVGLGIQFLSWRYLISQNATDFNQKDIFPSFVSGFTFRLMIPGGHAELSKIFLLPGRKRGKALAFAIDKSFQAYVKIMMVLVVLPVTFPAYALYAYGFVVLLLLSLFFIPKIKLLKEFQETGTGFLPMLPILLLIFSFNFVVMASQYYILLNQVHHISFLDTAHTSIYLWASGVVPVSISGLGVREGLAVYFFRMHGIPNAYAIATSLFLFVLNQVLPALFGIYYIYKNRRYFREIRRSFHSTLEIYKSFRNNKSGKRS
jgi:uncharacterized membrane protein YbhN (UPF0104 family)